jgi:hypothetical protein
MGVLTQHLDVVLRTVPTFTIPISDGDGECYYNNLSEIDCYNKMLYSIYHHHPLYEGDDGD